MKKIILLFTLMGLGLSPKSQTIVGTSPTDKNVVLEELTGKTCQFCPDGHKRADQLIDNNPGRVVVLNIHEGGYASGTPNYTTSWGDYVGGLFSVSGYPTGAINRTDFGDGVMHSRGDWATNAATILGQPSPVNVGGEAIIDLDTRELTLDVEAYYTASGPGTENRIHVVITQNNIEGPQTGASSWYPEMILANGNYQHNKMVRHTLTPNSGDVISNISSTSLYTNSYTYSIPTQINNIPVELSDLKVAVYVTEGASTGAVITGDYASVQLQTAIPLAASNGDAAIEASLGAVCGTSADATMKITNMGNTDLSTVTIEYSVNGGTAIPYQHTFTQPLATGAYEEVPVNITGLTSGGAMSSINFEVTMLNGSANPNTNTSTGHTVSTASTATVGSLSGTVSITTDDYGSETTWELYDETAGSTVASGGPYSSNNTQQPTVNVNVIDGNCYRFIVYDAYGDGICCSYGNGSFLFKLGALHISSGGNFGAEDGEKFVVEYDEAISSVLENQISDLTIYPNPVNNFATLSFNVEGMERTYVELVNTIGQTLQTIDLGVVTGSQLVELNALDLPSGIYLVNIKSGTNNFVTRMTVTK